MWGRFYNFYGDENARISRYQAVQYDPVTAFPSITVVASWVSFKISQSYLLKLDRVFVDTIVYDSEWICLIKECISDWTDTLRSVSLHLAHFYVETVLTK